MARLGFGKRIDSPQCGHDVSWPANSFGKVMWPPHLGQLVFASAIKSILIEIVHTPSNMPEASGNPDTGANGNFRHHHRKTILRAQNHRGKTPGAGRRVQCGAWINFMKRHINSACQRIPLNVSSAPASLPCILRPRQRPESLADSRRYSFPPPS